MTPIKKVYNYYYYNTPIPVLSVTETVFFNIFNVLVVTIGTYLIGRSIGYLSIPA